MSSSFRALPCRRRWRPRLSPSGSRCVCEFRAAVGLLADARSMGRARGLSQMATSNSANRRRTTPTPRIWTEERLEAELRAFLDGHDRWPAKSEFVAAGRFDLYSAVLRYDRQAFWAQRFGLPLAGKWTDETLEKELPNVHRRAAGLADGR